MTGEGALEWGARRDQSGAARQKARPIDIQPCIGKHPCNVGSIVRRQTAPKLATKLARVHSQDMGREAEHIRKPAGLLVVREQFGIYDEFCGGCGGELGTEPGVIERELPELVGTSSLGQM